MTGNKPQIPENSEKQEQKVGQSHTSKGEAARRGALGIDVSNRLFKMEDNDTENYSELFKGINDQTAS